jgi:hypothetical protein
MLLRGERPLKGTIYQLFCEDCGEEFDWTVPASGATPPKYCPTKCRKKRRSAGLENLWATIQEDSDRRQEGGRP